MIKVVFDHIEGFGKITEQDFIYSDPKGIAEGRDYIDYLNQGWIEWGDYWYNLRSVRLDLRQYSATKTTKKLAREVTYKSHRLTPEIIELLEPIYLEYVEKHNFKRAINLKDFLNTKDFFVLLYYREDRLIGALIYKLYRQSNEAAFVSYQFLWDYKEPKLSLGNISQMYESHLANLLDCRYLYILGGYEESCIYKSHFKGFQWWTGKEWSKDTTLYTKLCQRDNHAHIRTP
jgi:hypothetical protein